MICLLFFHLLLRSLSPDVRNDPFSGKRTLKSQLGKEGPSRAGCCLPSPGEAARQSRAPRAGLRLCQGTKGTEKDRGGRALRGSDTENSRSRAGHRKYPKPPNVLERFHTRTQLPTAKCHRYLPRAKLSPAQRNQHRSESRPWQISHPSQTHPSGSACAWVNQIFVASKKRRSERVWVPAHLVRTSLSTSQHAIKKREKIKRNKNENKQICRFPVYKNSTQPSLGWSLEWEQKVEENSEL